MENEIAQNSWADSTMAEGNEWGSALRVVQADEILFREGDPGDVAFVVESGAVEIFRIKGKQEVVLATLERGSLFGEMALIDDQPRSANARASSESVVKQIGRKEFLQHLRSSPDAAFKMMQQLVAIIRQLNDKLCLESLEHSDLNDG